jgi:hypothetical protein
MKTERISLKIRSKQHLFTYLWDKKRQTGSFQLVCLFCLWGTKKMDCIFDRWIRTPEEIHAPILQVKDALSGNSFAAFAHKYSAQK